jgi:hypothetical protein
MNDAKCYACGAASGAGKAECRPYGPNGSWVCAGCCFSDASKIAEAERQLARQLDACGDVATIGDGNTGPRPATSRERRLAGVSGKRAKAH